MLASGLHGHRFTVIRSGSLLKLSRLFVTSTLLRNVGDRAEPLQEITTLNPGLGVSDSNSRQRANARLE